MMIKRTFAMYEGVIHDSVEDDGDEVTVIGAADAEDTVSIQLRGKGSMSASMLISPKTARELGRLLLAAGKVSK